MEGVFIALILIIVVSVIAMIVLIILADHIIYFLDSLDLLFCYGAKEHVPGYEGIVENTLFGKKDIFCPKCKCPDCMYVYVCGKKVITPFELSKRKRKLGDVFNYSMKDLIKEELENSKIEEKYKCNKCGYIFK